MNFKLASRSGRKRKMPHPKRETETLTFGAKLRALRQQKGIGLRKLAAMIGVSPPYLSNIERGKSPSLSEVKLNLIAHMLQVSPDLLANNRPSDIMIVDPACGTAQTLGEALRELRLEMGIGLREFAAKVGISAPYLSNIERGKLLPPSEEKLCLIAGELNQDPDQWLAKAGKVRSDLLEIIMEHPREYAAILRSMRKFRESDFRVFVKSLAQQFDAHLILIDPPYTKTEARKELRRNVHPPIDWKLLRETFGGDSQARSERNECDAVSIPLRRNKSKDADFWAKARDRVRSVEASIDKEMVAVNRAPEKKGKNKARKSADGVLART
jgi:transcriptional regulator with XRE-family HTH domain